MLLLIGQFFGEIALFSLGDSSSNRRSASARSIGFTELYVLDKESLDEIRMHDASLEACLVQRAQQHLEDDRIRKLNAAKKKEEEDRLMESQGGDSSDVAQKKQGSSSIPSTSSQARPRSIPTHPKASRFATIASLAQESAKQRRAFKIQSSD